MSDPSTPPTAAEYPYPEAEVRKITGLSREVLKRTREQTLCAVEHYERVGGGISFSRAGLEAVCALIGVNPPPDPSKEKKPAGEALAKPVEETMLLAVGQICPNPIWVKCRLPDGTVAPVRVLNNRRMQHGQVMQVVRVNGVLCHDMKRVIQ